MRIAHIINPVKVSEDRDLHWQQPIVFESMFYAREFYYSSGGLLNKPTIDFVATFYPEDTGIAPVNFTFADFLEMSALDVQDFRIPKKLPLFKEILQKLYDTSNADYFVYTNADICLMPHFYVFIKDLIEKGNDAFCINKRIIPEDLKDSGLAMMWSNLGTPHAGHDCFVFRRELQPLFNLGNSCVGAPWGETTLVTNLVMYAKNFQIFTNQHATFGIGDRRGWIEHKFNDYRILCTNEFARILKKFSKRNKKILKHPVIQYLLSKLVSEVRGYSQEIYSKDCWYFVNKGKKVV